ncbi:hypothetical protein [Sphingomonas sp. NFR15]|uniref:hypothetical protein n=1 Tax=Sphingomonas sp. NFR15 TaxID=1566282 RepID=UPI003524EF2E
MGTYLPFARSAAAGRFRRKQNFADCHNGGDRPLTSSQALWQPFSPSNVFPQAIPDDEHDAADDTKIIDPRHTV